MVFSNSKAQNTIYIAIFVILVLSGITVLLSLQKSIFIKPHSKSEIVEECRNLCDDLSNQETFEKGLEMVYKYCTKSFRFNPETGEGKIENGVYIGGSNKSIFCPQKARCFNLYDCELGINDIQACKYFMCIYLYNKDMEKKEIERKIKEDLSPGCDLSGIPENWWTENFEGKVCSDKYLVKIPEEVLKGNITEKMKEIR